MAEILLKYFKYVTDKHGPAAKTKLAQLTCVPSILAANEPDTPANIKKFKDAVEQITGDTAPEF